MRHRALIAAAAIALAAGGAGTSMAMDKDHDQGVTGSPAAKARSAALRYTNGGTAGGVERDSEHGSTWDVEVTRRDGSHVDVRLNADLGLVEITSNEDDAK